MAATRCRNIKWSGGALVAIGAIAAGSGPWYITVEASGRYVYVANFNDNTVSQYSLGAGRRAFVHWYSGDGEQANTVLTAGS